MDIQWRVSVGVNMELTREQNLAATLRGENILVSAAAGSGKTAVLAQRVLNLLTDSENPVDADKLLIVTYTNAAASQMKRRIMDSIKARLVTEPHNALLRKQSLLINKARITTMSSFCLSVVRGMFHDLGIDPRVRVCSDSEASALKNDTAAALFEQLYMSEDYNFFHRLLRLFCNSATDEPLKIQLLRLYEQLMGVPDYRIWLADQAAGVNSGMGGVWFDYLIDYLDEQLKTLSERASDCMNFAAEANASEKYVAHINYELSLIEVARRLLRVDFSAFVAAMDMDFSRAPMLKDVDDSERIKAMRDEYKDAITKMYKSVFAKGYDALMQELADEQPIVADLARLAIEFDDAYKDAKRARGWLDFSDFEHLTLSALIQNGEETELAAALRDSFAEIAVDEYQDINPVQERILSTISRKYSPNRFMVGDIKQSIYRFRLAEPALFAAKYREFGSGSGGVRIDLNANFRSSAAVLDSVNTIFDQIMSERLGGVNYNTARLIPASTVYTDSPESVRLTLIDKQADYDEISEAEAESDPNNPSASDFSNAELEAAYIAKRIREMLDAKIPITLRDSTKRPARPQDFAILMRSTNELADVFARALTAQNIPSVAPGEKAFFTKTEVSLILSFLRVIDNPRQDIHLISVMRSPLYGFSDAELAAIKLSGRRVYYDCVTAYGLIGENAQLRDKCSAFITALNDWRDTARELELPRLVWRLIFDTGYFDIVGAMRGGKLRRANLMALFELTAGYTDTDGAGMFGFIRYIERAVKRREQREGAKLSSESADAVRIMTIHGSKGLEFPVVFVCGLNRALNAGDERNNLLFHQNMGLTTVLYDDEAHLASDSLRTFAFRKRIREERVSEEMRVLYVALTRCMEYLELVGTVTNLPRVLDKLTDTARETALSLPHVKLAEQNTYLKWIISALLRHKDAAILRDMLSSEIPVNSALSGRFDISILSARTLSERTNETSAESALYALLCQNPSADAKIAARLDYRYPYAERGEDVPSKVSVSEIKRRFAAQLDSGGAEITEHPRLFSKPSFMQGKLSSSERGTLIHTCLQHLDIRRIQSLADVEAQLDELTNKNLLRAEHRRFIEPQKLLVFAKSPLAARIATAARVWREMPFVMRLSPHDLNMEADTETPILAHGVIDCVFEENEKLYLVDYKTDHVETEADIPIIIERYHTQIDLYRRAAADCMGLAVGGCYIYLYETNNAIEV